MGEKARYLDVTQWRRYPLGRFNSATAQPLSAALAAMRATPNQVSVLSLLVSLVGIVAVAAGDASMLVAGALLVHVGLLLDHADGQVARRRGMGSTWGMYLDMVIDRIVETGLIVATVAAALRRAPGLTTPWMPLPDLAVAMLAVVAIAAMLTWRFLNAYNDVLYLRSHLLATGRIPAAVPATPGRGVVFTRDWVFLIWLVGTILGQHLALLALLAGLHGLVCLGKIRAFWLHHRQPEVRAAAVLDRDYH